MIADVRRFHWEHYAIEAWGLGTFMFVAGSVAVAMTALPDPFRLWLASHAIVARGIFGLAMGATAIAIVYSKWGARSGAHLNPALTLTFACLGKLPAVDAAGYVAAQFAGGFAGFTIAAFLYGKLLTAPPANAIVTMPGDRGTIAAFVAEACISFILVTVVLTLSNAAPSTSRFTGIAAGTLVALFITFEAPLSGMSMNPARTLASALVAHHWDAIWVYFTAPPLGMLLAAGGYVWMRGPRSILCGRLNHTGSTPCIFRCDHML